MFAVFWVLVQAIFALLKLLTWHRLAFYGPITERLMAHFTFLFVILTVVKVIFECLNSKGKLVESVSRGSLGNNLCSMNSPNKLHGT